MIGRPQVVVSFDQYGNTKIDAQCFVGSKCAEATAYIEQALGGQKTADDKKPEYFANADTSTSVAQRF